jgi:hypothetical protein
MLPLLCLEIKAWCLKISAFPFEELYINSYNPVFIVLKSIFRLIFLFELENNRIGSCTRCREISKHRSQTINPNIAAILY